MWERITSKTDKILNFFLHEPADDAAVTPQSKLQRIHYKRLVSSIVIFMAALIILGSAVIKVVSPLFFNVSTSRYAYFEVVTFSPQYTIYKPLTPIVIEFNGPVTVHHAQKFVNISPSTDGEFQQGKNRNQLVFTPRTAWRSGQNVVVYLMKGLPSDNGKRLMEGKEYYFRLPESNQSMLFESNSYEGKFMSFPEGQTAKIAVKTGYALSGTKVRLYKADPETLLNSLTYIYTDKSPTYEGYKQFVEKPIDNQKMTLIKEYQTQGTPEIIEIKQEAGLYLLAGFDGDKNIANAWIAFNKTGIHLRQDDQNVFLAAQDLKTGQPVDGIKVRFYSLEENPHMTAEHTLGSIQSYPLAYPQKLDIAVAQKDDDIMIIPVSVPNSQAEILVSGNLNERDQIFIYTDRPLYKSGEKVYYRGIVRNDNDGLYQGTKSQKVRVFLENYSSGDQKQFVNQTVDIKPGGVFSGEFIIPKEMGAYTQYLYATTKLEEPAPYPISSAFFDVFEYQKPDFTLDVSVDSGEVIKGETVNATIQGKYLNGKPMSGSEVYYTIYRRDFYETEKAVYNKSFNLNSWGGMCGGGFDPFDEYFGETLEGPKTVKLDNNGLARISYNTSQLPKNLSHEITIVTQNALSDASYETNSSSRLAEEVNAPVKKSIVTSAKNAVVHQGEFNIFIRPGSASYASGQELTAAFHAEDLWYGTVQDRELDYEIYEQKYIDYNTVEEKKIYKKGTLKLDNEGNGVIKEVINVDQPTTLYARVFTTDSKGNLIEVERSFYFEGKKTPEALASEALNPYDRKPKLAIISKKNNLKQGENSQLEIQSPQDLSVLVSFERGRVYQPQWLQLKKGNNVFDFPVRDEFVPSITPTFSFFMDGMYFVEGLSLNVPALQKLITVEVSLDKPKYAPNDTALLTVVTKDAAGNLVSAKTGIGIVDKGIYGLRKNATQPIHSSFYFFRDRKTNSSSSLTWIATFDYGGRGGGGGGGGDGTGKDVPTLFWNSDLQTGSDGRLTIPVQVGWTETTWRAQVFVSTDDSKFGQSEVDFLVAK